MHMTCGRSEYVSTVIDGVRYEGCPGTVKDAIAHNQTLESIDPPRPERSIEATDEAPGLGEELLSILALFAFIGLALFIAGGI